MQRPVLPYLGLGASDLTWQFARAGLGTQSSLFGHIYARLTFPSLFSRHAFPVSREGGGAGTG